MTPGRIIMKRTHARNHRLFYIREIPPRAHAAAAVWCEPPPPPLLFLTLVSPT